MHNVSDYELYHSFPSRRNSARNSAVCFAWQKIEVPLEKEKGMEAGKKKQVPEPVTFFLFCSEQVSKCKQVKTSPAQFQDYDRTIGGFKCGHTL